MEGAKFVHFTDFEMKYFQDVVMRNCENNLVMDVFLLNKDIRLKKSNMSIIL